MTKQKLYFKSIDDTMCTTLESHLEYAKSDGLTEITLIEALLDTDTNDFIWCTHDLEVVERSMCKKSECSYYRSKNNRGTCWHRGQLYCHGEEITFNVY